ncbi:GTA baseplate fiber-binding domain-containing protein [Novosphingobium huizhouense]|uniref:GTA baseplate fiber-binding domain-containing protein n=1 Tax=Novosphingobium huizhouense TaxID=2866625 RepID=UPI001CD86D1C|nr:phage tail protein [Novosphingobium huizhouense]
MATLVLTAVGTVLGGPIGGAIGALAGRQIDKAIFAGGARSGPRLQDLKIQTSSYGDALPLHFGTIRTAGSVIWSTELVEHEETGSSGKGQPKVKTYEYTASFAVAVSSRPIKGIGRIWADGNLLRGAAGDLKAGGTVRVHTGHGDQAPDPLMAQAEAAGRCPAHRGIAFVVFEDLQLSSFGNRIPSLTFEVIADDHCDLATILAEIAPEARCAVTGDSFDGFTIDQGSAADTISAISAAIPLATWVSDEVLSVVRADRATATIPLLAEPAANEDDRGRSRSSGWAKRREPMPAIANCAVRYYDTTRDYQPGFQRGKGRSEQGEMRTIDLPAALPAERARAIADAATLRLSHAVERISYRTTEIDPALLAAPIVRVPVAKGLWRVEDWEWQKDGVSLNLASIAPGAITDVPAAGGTDPGRYNAPADLSATATVLAAFELPWDGTGAEGEAPLQVAASSAGAGWKGAALFAGPDDAATGLAAIGAVPARRATLGETLSGPGAGSPLIVDLRNTLDVALASPDFSLRDADMAQLAAGANLALVGDELLQFGKAVPLGGARWRLSTLLRGRGGTEWAVGSHNAAGEPFVLVDSRVVRIAEGSATDAGEVVAIGIGDPVPVRAPVRGRGSALRPLSPVHGRAAMLPDGSLAVSWVRRARGAWRWSDEVEVPLNEESEAWEVTLGDPAALAARFVTATSSLTIAAARLAPFGTAPYRIAVRQVGKNSMSKPLIIVAG